MFSNHRPTLLYTGDSANKAKIENIFLLKLSHFFGNFFHEIYSRYISEGMYVVVPTENAS